MRVLSEKKLLDKYIHLTVEAYEKNSERSSFERGEDGSFKFILDVCCPTWEGSSEWNRMVADAKVEGEGGIFNFFADILNDFPIRNTSRAANFAGIKFCALML